VSLAMRSRRAEPLASCYDRRHVHEDANRFSRVVAPKLLSFPSEKGTVIEPARYVANGLLRA